MTRNGIKGNGKQSTQRQKLYMVFSWILGHWSALMPMRWRALRRIDSLHRIHRIQVEVNSQNSSSELQPMTFPNSLAQCHVAGCAACLSGAVLAAESQVCKSAKSCPQFQQPLKLKMMTTCSMPYTSSASVND